MYTDPVRARIPSRFSLLPPIAAIALSFWACSTAPRIPDTEKVPPPEPLVLTFAGDIMAHDVNYSMRDYDRIYHDLSPLLHSDDLSFVNLETPVADALPMSNYPRFNVHRSYLEAAVDAGFDVFSLANNHTNDQGLAGMAGTRDAVRHMPEGVYANGIRLAPGEAFRPEVIRIRDWTIIFLAVTEILNSHDKSAHQVQYSAPTKAGRSALLERISEIDAQHPGALFVLSIHTNEPEYVRTVSAAKKRWFAELARSGADIVWANHPHVMQPWELVSVDGRDCLFMYSMGNFISGQRWRPDFANPGADREYTGDAVLLQLRTHSGGEPGTLYAPEIVPVPVTNYLDPDHGMVVRRFSSSFIGSLPERLAAYYRNRYELMRGYLPVLPTMPQASILE